MTRCLTPNVVTGVYSFPGIVTHLPAAPPQTTWRDPLNASWNFVPSSLPKLEAALWVALLATLSHGRRPQGRVAERDPLSGLKFGERYLFLQKADETSTIERSLIKHSSIRVHSGSLLQFTLKLYGLHGCIYV